MTSVPAFARFRGETVLLVGSDRRAADLLLRFTEAGARVRWFSPDVDVAEAIWLSGRPDTIEIALREPRTLDLAQAAAVIVTVGEPIARRISEEARALRRPVAVLGHPELSTTDLDDPDDSDSGDVQRWQPLIGAPLAARGRVAFGLSGRAKAGKGLNRHQTGKAAQQRDGCLCASETWRR